MRVVHHSDGPEVELRIRQFLLEDEVSHALMIGLLDQADGPGRMEGAHLSAVEHQGAVIAASLVSGYVITVARCTSETALDMLAADALACVPGVPGIGGLQPEAGRFLASWRPAYPDLEILTDRQLLWKATSIRQPKTPLGRLRPADAQDLPRLLDWHSEFSREVGSTVGTSQRQPWIAERLERQELWVWDDGGAVCMTSARGRTPTGISISGVYTAPTARGRGYAAATVAAVSQLQLDAGRSFCYLFSQQSNPIAHHIYASIGFEPVAEAARYLFA